MMRRGGLCVVMLACMVAKPSFSPGRQPEAPETGPEEVPLSFEAGTLGNVVTPRRALRREKYFWIDGDHGHLYIGGVGVLVAGRWEPAAHFLGLDCDGDGDITGGEWIRLGPTGNGSFRLKLKNNAGGARDYAVSFIGVKVYARIRSAVAIRGRYWLNCCQKGRYAGVTVRIIDDDMDGRYTQGGADVIAIGNSRFALPLRKIHQIGRRHCQLRVAPDGSSIVFTPLNDLKLGVVELPYKPSALTSLVLTGRAGQSYDLKVSGRTGIPAGDYKLSYGVLGSGGKPILILPTNRSPARSRSSAWARKSTTPGCADPKASRASSSWRDRGSSTTNSCPESE